MKGAGGAIIIIALMAIILAGFICPLTDGSAQPAAQKFQAPAWAPPKNGVLGLVGSVIDEETAKRRANIELLAAQSTAEWHRLNDTPTPIPTPTNTPEPTETPAPTATPAPTIKGVVKDAGDIMGMIFWGVFLAGLAMIGAWLLWRYGNAGVLWMRNAAQTIARSSTGDVIVLGADGRLRKTATMVESELVPQPEPDALDKLERARQYAATGTLPAQPERELSKSNAPDATAGQRLALGATSQVAAAMGAALGGKTSNEQLNAMRMLELMGGRRSRRADKSLMEMVADTGHQLASGQDQWQVVKNPSQIEVIDAPGAADQIQRAQVKYIAERCQLTGSDLEPWMDKGANGETQ